MSSLVTLAWVGLLVVLWVAITAGIWAVLSADREPRSEVSGPAPNE